MQSPYPLDQGDPALPQTAAQCARTGCGAIGFDRRDQATRRRQIGAAIIDSTHAEKSALPIVDLGARKLLLEPHRTGLCDVGPKQRNQLQGPHLADRLKTAVAKWAVFHFKFKQWDQLVLLRLGEQSA